MLAVTTGQYRENNTTTIQVCSVAEMRLLRVAKQLQIGVVG
jgi:hypothetical protein